MTKIGSFFGELRRRNVFKVAVAYVVVGWLLIQAANNVLPNVGLPPWAVTLVIVLVAVGFPVALMLAWAYELQPEPGRTASDEPARAVSATTITESTTADSPSSTAPAHTESKLAPAVGNEERPSLAVLPFLNMMGDPGQEYFADGMTEDLITDLSKISGLCVIARNSTFTFKGQAVDVREAAQTLGARYVVEGSVRKAGERVRINAQLIDAQSGGHVWAERYDGDLAEVFELQDEILAKIVSALRVNLNVGEKRRLESRLTSDLAAYDLFLRGRGEIYRFSPESLAPAIELLERAVALDPGFAAAYAYLSQARMADALFRPSPVDFEAGLREALKVAETAVACDESLGLAHAFLAWIQLWLFRHADATASFERALALAPNDADVLGHYAQALNYSGEPERAIAMLERAATLDPLLPANIRFARGVSLFLLRRQEDALEAIRSVRQFTPGFAPGHFLYAVTLTELGRVEEATALLKSEAQNLPPASSFMETLRRVPFRDDRYRERIAAGLRAAGVLD